MLFDVDSFLLANATKGLTAQEWRALSRYSSTVSEGVRVEIGSFRGMSATALAYGMGPAESGEPGVFCIEPHAPFTGVYGGKFGPNDRGAFYRRMLETGFFDRVALVNLKSEIAARCWDRPIGLLFIDGDHRIDAVRADVEAWLPHVTPGGIVSLDDATDPAVGPAHIVRELVDAGECEFLEHVGKVAFLRKRRGAR